MGRACHSLRGSFHWWNRLRGFCMFFHARSTGIPRTAAAAASPLPLPRQSWRHLPLSVSCRHRAAVAPAAAVSPAPPRLDPAGRQRGPRPDDWAGRRPRGAALPGRHAPVPPPPLPPLPSGCRQQRCLLSAGIPRHGPTARPRCGRPPPLRRPPSRPTAGGPRAAVAGAAPLTTNPCAGHPGSEAGGAGAQWLAGGGLERR